MVLMQKPKNPKVIRDYWRQKQREYREHKKEEKQKNGI